MVLSVPADTFSACVIRTMFQPQYYLPISVEKHDALYARLIVLSCENTKSDAAHLAEAFTEVLDLDVPNHIGERLQKMPLRLGMKLKRFARNIFHEYVYARHSAGMQVVVSISNFCSEHEIELDIDISFDALEKSWKRFFITKNREIFDRNRRINVLISGRKLHTQKRGILPLSDEQLNTLIENYRKEHRDLFYYKRRGQRPFRQKLNEQLKAYVLHHIGGRSTAFCCQKLKINDRCLRRRVESFKIFLENAPAVL